MENCEITYMIIPIILLVAFIISVGLFIKKTIDDDTKEYEKRLYNLLKSYCDYYNIK